MASKNDDGEAIAASNVRPSTTCSLPLINFLRGWPSPSLLPISLLKDSASAILQDHLDDPTSSAETIAALQYAPDHGPYTLRKALATFLSSFFNAYTPPVPISHIVTTGGASQSLGVALTVVADPNYTRAWLLEPTYFLAFGIFADVGLKTEGIDVGPEWDLSELRKRLEEVESERRNQEYKPPTHFTSKGWKVYKHIIYCVPTFSNPTGQCMPLSVRESLVTLARKFDALIICDDVYDFVWWDATTLDSQTPQGSLPFSAVLPRLVDVDRSLDPKPLSGSFGNVLSNGSFSKIAGPGVRTGWVQSSTALLAQTISQAGVTRSGGAASNLTGTILAHSLRTGALEKHMRETLGPAYAKRWRLLVGAIEEELGLLGVKIIGGKGDEVDVRVQQVDGMPRLVAGGFFIWIKLPKGLTDIAVTARALEDANVAVASESQTRLPPKDGKPQVEGKYLRLCFAFEDEDKLVEGVKRLRGVLENMKKELEEDSVSSKKPNTYDAHQYA